MGVANSSSSRLSDLQENEYLQQFAGKESISCNDPFWNQFLSFTFAPSRTRADCQLLEESIKSILKNLTANNIQTGNFGSLLRKFLLYSSELNVSTQCENSVALQQTYNALFILRCVTKYFIETLTEENVLKQFQARPNGNYKDKEEDGPLLERFISCLLEIIIDVPVVNITYFVAVETVNILLVLLSVQMFSKSAAKSSIYRTIMQGKCSIYAFLLINVLLQHYYKQEKRPPKIHSNRGSFVPELPSLAFGLWNALTLGCNFASTKLIEGTVLANQSLLLLLVLVNHCTAEKSFTNPYRQALFFFTNSEEFSGTASSDVVPAFKLDYAMLYSTLCATLVDGQTTLLLYLLLHSNKQFETFVHSRTDMDTFVVPILKILYHAPERSFNDICMALIVLLILSEDNLFNRSVHDVMLKNISWYTERIISEISLGGLLVLVVIRTIRYIMIRLQDNYLLTNCLAILANMSNHFKALHPYVCQRFVSLFENLSKRLSSGMDQLRNVSTSTRLDIDDDIPSDLMQDLRVLEDSMRMVLEILNSCLTAQLSRNSNLLYSLLHRRHVFEVYQAHPKFEDIIQNIHMLLVYLSLQLETLDKNLSVSEVSNIIQQAALKWPSGRLKKLPELKIKYEEGKQPEEFFVPYAWSLVFHSSNIYWNPQNINLFNAGKEL